jgi:MFS family permease
VKSYTPLAAGLGVLPFALSMVLIAPRGPRVAARISVRRTIALGMACAGVGGLLLGLLQSHTAYIWYALILLLMAIGSGLSNPSATASIMTSLPISKAGVGSAVNDTTREVGGALGIAVIGSIATSVYRHAVRDDLAALPPEAAARARDSIGQAVHLNSDPAFVAHIRDGFTKGLNVSMIVGGVVALAGAALVMRYYPRDAELTRGGPGH